MNRNLRNCKGMASPRENLWQRVTVDLTSNWLRKWREFFNQSYSILNRGSSKLVSTNTLKAL